jgi:putative hydrolase of the HAD superfamily
MPPDGLEFGELAADLHERGLNLMQPIVLHDGGIARLPLKRQARSLAPRVRGGGRRHDRAATSLSAWPEACGIILWVATGEPLGAVLCDVDGVVRHWDREATAALELEYGLSTGTISVTAFAPDLLASAVTGRISDEEWRAEVAQRLTSRCGSSSQASDIVERWSGPIGRVDDDVLELLRRARRVVPVALVSNATTRLERDLRLLGVTDVIPHVVNSARIGAAKPEPAIYLAAAGQVGQAPSRCLFVDDIPANVHAAEALGMSGLIYREVAELRRALEPLLSIC